MKIAIASDHRGYHLKEKVISLLKAKGHEVADDGPSTDESVDYPDFAALVASKVSNGTVDRGILICGTGLGMAIAANKIAGIRAVAVVDETSARLGREHNDANVLALGARLTSTERAVELVDIFLNTPFSGGRHQQRVDKLAALDHTPR